MSDETLARNKRVQAQKEINRILLASNIISLIAIGISLYVLLCK